jgi:hypothetical protein
MAIGGSRICENSDAVRAASEFSQIPLQSAQRKWRLGGFIDQAKRQTLAMA